MFSRVSRRFFVGPCPHRGQGPLHWFLVKEIVHNNGVFILLEAKEPICEF